MDSDPVAGAPDALEYLQGRLLAALEGPDVDALGLDGARQGPGRRVVPRGRYGPHGGPDVVLPHGLAQQQAHVLCAVIIAKPISA